MTGAAGLESLDPEMHLVTVAVSKMMSWHPLSQISSSQLIIWFGSSQCSMPALITRVANAYSHQYDLLWFQPYMYRLAFKQAQTIVNWSHVILQITDPLILLTQFSPALIEIVMTYRWQCTECKSHISSPLWSEQLIWCKCHHWMVWKLSATHS